MLLYNCMKGSQNYKHNMQDIKKKKKAFVYKHKYQKQSKTKNNQIQQKWWLDKSQ